MEEMGIAQVPCLAGSVPPCQACGADGAIALRGVLSMAQVVDWLTASQVRYHLGALPVLYALLETLQVRQIINRHCPTHADVDHGTVAIVLVLNRLMLPLPLYQIADWVGQTMLVGVLGVPASKFNDDRLGRTLDALYPHLGAIWLDIIEVVLRKTDVDLSVIFYDVTAFVAQGRYAESELIDFGFAHNTPSNKRKLKLGLNAVADGGIPWLYQTWSGRTADQATVEQNLDEASQLAAQAWSSAARNPGGGRPRHARCRNRLGLRCTGLAPLDRSACLDLRM